MQTANEVLDKCAELEYQKTKSFKKVMYNTMTRNKDGHYMLNKDKAKVLFGNLEAPFETLAESEKNKYRVIMSEFFDIITVLVDAACPDEDKRIIV